MTNDTKPRPDIRPDNREAIARAVAALRDRAAAAGDQHAAGVLDDAVALIYPAARRLAMPRPKDGA